MTAEEKGAGHGWPPARTVAVQLEGGGTLVLPCPAWCEGHGDPRTLMHPNDVAHTSRDQPVTVTTDRGEVELLATGLDHAPYSTLSSRAPGAVVYLAGEYYRFDTPAALYALADQVAERVPAALRELGDRLAALLDDEAPG